MPLWWLIKSIFLVRLSNSVYSARAFHVQFPPSLAAHSENRLEQPTCHRQNRLILHRVSLPAKLSATAVTHFGLRFDQLAAPPERVSTTCLPEEILSATTFKSIDRSTCRQTGEPCRRCPSARLAQPQLVLTCFYSSVFFFETLPRRYNRGCSSDTPTVLMIGRSRAF